MGTQSKGPKEHKKRIPDKRKFQEIQKGAGTDGTLGRYGNPFYDDATSFYSAQKGEVEGEVEQTKEQAESILAKSRKDKETLHMNVKTIALIIGILIPIVAATLYVSNINNKVELVKQSVEGLRKNVDKNYELIMDLMHSTGILKKDKKE